mgnify:CR=1 FL=1
MATIIEQHPFYDILPIGQQVIFAVSNDTIVANNFRVKFIAEVYVSNTAITWASSQKVGSFKTTPNNAGVGIFDFRPVLESFVKPDHEPNTTIVASSDSEYKGEKAQTAIFPIHLLDKFSVSNNSIKRFAVRFKVEYFANLTTSTITVSDPEDSDEYKMFNGVLQYDDALLLSNGNYGYDLSSYYLNGTTKSFLSNAPTTQYARLEDYGTMAFFQYIPNSTYAVSYIKIDYIFPSGSSTENINWTSANGGITSQGPLSNTRIGYFGCFPANLKNWSSTFATAVTNGLTSYQLKAYDTSGRISQQYNINILCPNERDYEGIRLTWLNQWGTWDYYTFNMKSTKSIETNRTSYTQLGGTWNESKFKISDFKGGKKNFRVNSKEKIKLNTDFVTEEEGVWFEELINSPEVYIVNGFSVDVLNTITNKYIEPVILTTSSYIKKTKANDRLMQYTIEIEKSRFKRTQAV